MSGENQMHGRVPAGSSRRAGSLSLRRFSSWLAILLLAALSSAAAQNNSRPNIVFILADDLGYGELGSYGQKLIRTPHLDRMAAEGMRFTQFYAGNAVCAPSRSVLMTGQHMGHTRVRGNAGRGNPKAQTLTAADLTVARLLQQNGYATGMVGKWGLGDLGTEGDPHRQGFDFHYGYVNQTHAHNHYPNFLWRDDHRVSLPNDLVPVGTVEGVGYSENRIAYADDLSTEESLDFLARHRERPFFLFVSLVTPHANGERARSLGDGNEVPDPGIYAKEPWTASARNHAAMVSRMDRDVGRLLEQLKKLGIEERTLVLFSSDNGPHKEGGPDYDPAFFQASGPLRGIKRDLTEGGIRMPLIARWPGHVKAGAVSDHVGYFGDFMATWAELAGVTPPSGLDSISFVPALLGRGLQPKHDYLYWEFYERGFDQAVLMDGRWKALRLKSVTAPVAIFDLNLDIGEKQDVANRHPELVARALDLFVHARVDNAYWRIPPDGAAPKK